MWDSGGPAGAAFTPVQLQDLKEIFTSLQSEVQFYKAESQKTTMEFQQMTTNLTAELNQLKESLKQTPALVPPIAPASRAPASRPSCPALGVCPLV